VCFSPCSPWFVAISFTPQLLHIGNLVSEGRQQKNYRAVAVAAAAAAGTGLRMQNPITQVHMFHYSLRASFLFFFYAFCNSLAVLVGGGGSKLPSTKFFQLYRKISVLQFR
jgi:hypothetical protein